MKKEKMRTPTKQNIVKEFERKPRTIGSCEWVDLPPSQSLSEKLDDLLKDAYALPERTEEEMKKTIKILGATQHYGNRKVRLWGCPACEEIYNRPYGKLKWKKHQLDDGRYRCMRCRHGVIQFIGVRLPGGSERRTFDEEKIQLETMALSCDPGSEMEKFFMDLLFDLSVMGKVDENQLNGLWMVYNEKIEKNRK